MARRTGCLYFGWTKRTGFCCVNRTAELDNDSDSILDFSTSNNPPPLKCFLGRRLSLATEMCHLSCLTLDSNGLNLDRNGTNALCTGWTPDVCRSKVSPMAFTHRLDRSLTLLDICFVERPYCLITRASWLARDRGVRPS